MGLKDIANSVKGAVMKNRSTPLPGIDKNDMGDARKAMLSGPVTQAKLSADREVLGKNGAAMPAQFRGRGYFNSNTGISAGHAAVLAKARAPFVSVDGQGRENIDVTAKGYQEAMDKATADYQPQYKSSGNTNPMWTMPYKEREAVIQDIRSAGCKDEAVLQELIEQAGEFGTESLTDAEKAVVERGSEAWRQAAEYMSALGCTDEQPNGSGEPVQDTGRYVRLRSPEGTTSNMLMELRPRMDVHYFVDLEMPEGQAQILALKEGAYEVAWEFEDSQMIRDGIQAAREFYDNFGYIPGQDCGRGDLAVSTSDLHAEARRSAGIQDENVPAEGEAQNESETAKADGVDNREAPAHMTEGQKALAAVRQAVAEDDGMGAPGDRTMDVPGE